MSGKSIIKGAEIVEELEDLNDMEFGDVLDVTNYLSIRRVIGGYIYEYYNYDKHLQFQNCRIIVSTVFIPEKQ
jgi:hypothetical protein